MNDQDFLFEETGFGIVGVEEVKTLNGEEIINDQNDIKINNESQEKILPSK